MDYSKHNDEVKQVWETYWAGKPIRVPCGNFTIGPRIWILDPKLNTEGITWEKFQTDPEVMFQCQLKYKYHLHNHVPHDIEMGIPENGWEIFTEFVNYFEPAWFGCEVAYPKGQVAITRPRYTKDRKREIFEQGYPDPFGGIMATIKEFYEYFQERAKNYEFHGKPVKILPAGHPLAANGVYTTAMDLCGDEILLDIYEDPEYVHELLDFIVEANIRRIKAWRKYLSQEEKPKCGGLGDDAIQMISTPAYIEHVLPYERKFMNALYGEGPHTMHLCGNVQRHLPTIIKELNVKTFDTGFPIKWETLRDEVGDDVHIMGGPRADFLYQGMMDEIRTEAKRILQSGIMRGGKFIMKEGNNMPPATPEENIRSMYETVREFGKYITI